MKHKLDTVSPFKILGHAASVWCLLVNFLNPATLTAVPVSTDATSLARLAILTNLSAGPTSFATVFATQVSSGGLNTITDFLTTAITPNAADTPNPPINGAATGPSLASLLNDQNCTNTGDCLAGFMPLAFALSKLPNPFPGITVAQYSNLMANLLYSGANINLANNQLNKYQLPSLQPKLLWPLTTPVILANFGIPDTTTYPGLAVDQYAGILIKTPVSTPAGTASKFCTDLVAANPLNLTNTAADPLTADNIWLGGICTNSSAVPALGSHCCGNNICNTTSGANLGQDSAGNAYGYCDKPSCTTLGEQPPAPTDCCAGLTYSNIMGTCLIAAGGACEPPASVTDFNPCLVGYICDSGYCLPQSGLQCLTAGQDLPAGVPVCANNLSCDTAPLMNYCCNILNDICSSTNDCCSIFTCDIFGTEPPPGATGKCKYSVGEVCDDTSHCMSPYVCGTNSAGTNNICCGQENADCSSGSDFDCCAGLICNIVKTASGTQATCVAGLPSGAACGEGNEENCGPNLVCDPCTKKCVSATCEAGGCAALNESCSVQSGCCGTNCYNATIGDACTQILTCALTDAAGKADSSCMASADPAKDCIGTCQFYGGFGSTCFGSYTGDGSGNSMCRPTDAAGLTINNVVCGNVDLYGGAGICCLPSSEVNCATAPEDSPNCFPGCTVDTDCCDNIAYNMPVWGPFNHSPAPVGLAKCVPNLATGQKFCQIDCLLLGTPCGTSAPTPSITGDDNGYPTYDSNTPACPGLDPNGELTAVCGDPSATTSGTQCPTGQCVNRIFFQLLPIGHSCKDASECATLAWRVTDYINCCVDPDSTACNTTNPVDCNIAGNECVAPATCQSIPSEGVCCVPSDQSTCETSADCCDDSLSCVDQMCTVPIPPPDEEAADLDIGIPSVLLISGVLTFVGIKLTSLSINRRITALGKAFDLSSRDIKSIRAAYVDGIFDHNAGDLAELRLARKNFADAIATAIYNKALSQNKLEDLVNVYGTDRVVELIDNISQSVQILIQQRSGDVTGMEGVIGALNQDALFGKGSALEKIGFACKSVGFLGVVIGEFMEGKHTTSSRVVAFLRRKWQEVFKRSTEEATEVTAGDANKIGEVFGLLSALPTDQSSNSAFVSTAKAAQTAAKTVAGKLNPTEYGPAVRPAITSPIVSAATNGLITRTAVEAMAGAPKDGYADMNAAFNAQPQKMARLYFEVMAMRVGAGQPVDDDASMSDAIGDYCAGKIKTMAGRTTNKYNLAGSFAELFEAQAESLNVPGSSAPASNIVTGAAQLWVTPADEGGMSLAVKQAICQALGLSIEADNIESMSVGDIKTAIVNSYQYLGDIQITYPDGSTGTLYAASSTGQYNPPDLFNFPDTVALGAVVKNVATIVTPVRAVSIGSAKSNTAVTPVNSTPPPSTKPLSIVKSTVKKQVLVKPAPVKSVHQK